MRYLLRYTVVALVAVSISVVFIAQGAAGQDDEQKMWSKLCASCHNGETAPEAEELKEKFQMVEWFERAALKKGPKCMNIVKNDRKLLRKIGLEIGLKE